MSTQSNPLVTIYITTYNRSELLARAIDSVVAQDYRPLEIIVVDDASSDSTGLVIERASKDLANDNGIQFSYLRQENNAGACAARNRAIMTATGEFITGLDDDDEFLPDRIGQFVNAWDQSYSALCTSLEIDHGAGKITYLEKCVGDITLQKLLDKNVVGSQIFTLTQRLRSIGGFDVEFPAWQDYECWIRMVLSFGEIKKLPKPTYRVHTSHDKPRITSNERDIDAIGLLLTKHGHRLSSTQRRLLKYKELTARKMPYKDIRVWLPAMTFRTFPRILKRWFKYNFSTKIKNKAL